MLLGLSSMSVGSGVSSGADEMAVRTTFADVNLAAAVVPSAAQGIAYRVVGIGAVLGIISDVDRDIGAFGDGRLLAVATDRLVVGVPLGFRRGSLQ